ncbi:hypothetical protein PLUTE_a3899 [Pseudoalteromonas luteoviolacea DSM 6061]|nr:hypothetical protein [Pseudoalteromonas luteoviolacea DSM 6061]
MYILSGALLRDTTDCQCETLSAFKKWLYVWLLTQTFREFQPDLLLENL